MQMQTWVALSLLDMSGLACRQLSNEISISDVKFWPGIKYILAKPDPVARTPEALF